MALRLNRTPLGLKAPKPSPDDVVKRRKGIARRSKKRLAYLASEDRKQGVEHMGKVAQLPCLVCGRYGVEVHHEGKPRSDMHVLPLCAFHHRREYGPQAYHYSARQFYERHGDSKLLLAKVADMLAGKLTDGWQE